MKKARFRFSGPGAGRRAGALAAGAACLFAGGAFLLLSSGSDAAQGNDFLRNGEAGFLVTRFAYVLGPDASEADICPRGMSSNVVDIFKTTPAAVRRPGESDDQYSKRLEEGGKTFSVNPDGSNVCLHPERALPDRHYRTLDVDNVRVDGLNLDGKISPANFTAPDGRKGIDNQLFRLVGCTNSFQSTGQSNGFDTSMYAGEWGVLIRLKGVDDLQNDDNVEVGIFASADPMQLSPTREALEYATYAMDQDPRFRAVTRGRIKNGILTTDPVDVRFHSVVNSMQLERPLRDARIQATITRDGKIKGLLAGYTPIEALYNYQYGYRDGKDGAGKLAPERLRLGSSNGAARVLGHTCPGVYQAMHRLADGHRDPATGKFTSISTQYRFEAVNAFLVDVETSSINDSLVRTNEN